jgi:hypothetical protein
LLNAAADSSATCASLLSGTSTLMIWLGSHPEIQCPQEENYNLMNEKPGQLVQDMYAQAPYENFLRGFKNPLDLFNPETSLKYIDQYFPKTKLIITLRHPFRYVSCQYARNFPAIGTCRSSGHAHD